MKNLSVYLIPLKKYNEETTRVLKIWIDNSLELGWKREDILFINNFPYEYNGVKSVVIDESSFCTFRPGSTKTVAVADLLQQGFMKKGEVYWVHDPDAFQLKVITETELGLGTADAGFTTYGWSPKWCLGSYFLKESAKDIFKWIKDTIYEIQNEDERALVKLTKRNFHNIISRIKTMDITYQIGMRNVPLNYQSATKPIKVVHFHPWYKGGRRTLNIFMYGRSELGKPLLSTRLIKIFHKHGIK